MRQNWKSVSRGLVISILLLNAILWSGCNKLSAPPNLNATPTITLNGSVPQQITPSQTVNISVQTTNDNGAGVSWSLASGNPGTLTNVTTTSATYTAPASVSAATPITITATSKANSSVTLPINTTVEPSSKATPTITLNGSVPSQISPSQAVNISVTTTNDNGAGVSWTLASGEPGVLSNMTITSVTYTAPASVSAATPIAITATSLADSAVSLQIATTVEPSAVAGGLNGQYAFLLQGFDTSDNAIAMIGSLTADGKGNITAGSIDVNYDFAIGQNTASVAGTYTADNLQRGRINITTSVSQVPQPLIFAYSLSTDGSTGSLISFDANNFQMSGQIQKQDGSAFTTSNLEKSFAFGLESNAQPPRQCEIGQFSIANSLVTGVSDTALAENGWGGEASFSGALLTGPDQSGRGSIHITGAPGTAGTLLIYYVVNANQLLLMEADAPTASITLLAGAAYQQKLPFGNQLPITNSVFALSGLDGNATITGPIATIGLLAASTSKFVFDTNDVGSILPSSSLPIQIMSFDPLTGRATLSSPNGLSNGLFDASIVYLYDFGAGFLMDATPDGRNRALMGRLWPQVQTSAPSGNMLARFGDGPDISVATMDAALTVNSNGDVTGAADVRLTGQTDISNQSLSGGTVSAADSNGRGSATLPGALFGLSPTTNAGDTDSIYYVIDTNRVVLINTVPGKPSGIGILDSQ